MDYTIERVNNEHKLALVDFEKLIRHTEADIWVGNFDADAYAHKLVEKDLETESNIVLCAYEGEKIIARCDGIIYESFSDFYKTGYIDWLYVEISYREKGIAKALVEEMIQTFKKYQVSSCYLFTAKNDQAQRFYKGLEILDLKTKEVAEKYL